ncbi:hypothetical protein G5B46_09735 [Caulobacter sp. 602-2]|uniref:VCBS repeat-containing protein n=1 Tax=Caulobacter sp. 602-2 TaxID=2710887 RepID=A0A6G4QXB3_9CAUL|nr:hypothetical protein [Caulobacter sp. 602-2]NGM49885.1 hypothetical protein [Caulobacter sp. 602-2]
MSALLIALAAALPSLAGDFDGDGKADQARLEPRGGAHVLVVERAAAPGKPETVTMVADASGFFIATQPPGAYPTTCAKDVGAPCAADEPRKVELKAPALAFGAEEASLAVAVWTGERFAVTWLND